MTTTAAADAAGGVEIEPIRGVQLVQVNHGLWRVTRRGGEMLGYVELLPSPQGDRFRAKRYRVRQRSFAELGDFWRTSDAVDALRFG